MKFVSITKSKLISVKHCLVEIFIGRRRRDGMICLSPFFEDFFQLGRKTCIITELIIS